MIKEGWNAELDALLSTSTTIEHALLFCKNLFFLESETAKYIKHLTDLEVKKKEAAQSTSKQAIEETQREEDAEKRQPETKEIPEQAQTPTGETKETHREMDKADDTAEAPGPKTIALPEDLQEQNQQQEITTNQSSFTLTPNYMSTLSATCENNEKGKFVRKVI